MRLETRSQRGSDVHVACQKILPVLFLLAVFALGCSRERSERIEWPVMGTIAAFQYRPWRDDIDTTPIVAAEAVRQTFADIERLLNAHDPNSELRRLAPLGEEEILARCDKSVSNCYAAAFRLMRESGGVFNPRWRGPGTMDLGAIAKGFAVDEAVRALGAAAGTEPGPPGAAAAGTEPGTPALIDLGGNLRSVGGTWKVGVSGSDKVLVLTNGMACATSGEYFRGKHIRDGRTGRTPTNGVYSVTVVHPSSAMLADGLTTTLFILGPDAGERFLRTHYPEARAIWVRE